MEFSSITIVYELFRNLEHVSDQNNFCLKQVVLNVNINLKIIYLNS